MYLLIKNILKLVRECLFISKNWKQIKLCFYVLCNTNNYLVYKHVKNPLQHL